MQSIANNTTFNFLSQRLTKYDRSEKMISVSTIIKASFNVNRV